MIECCNLLHTQLFNSVFEIGGWSKKGKKVFSEADIGFNCTTVIKGPAKPIPSMTDVWRW
jgi:hypothetical protein